MNMYGQDFVTDEYGIQVLNCFKYLDFYEAQIQPYTLIHHEGKKYKIYEGITADEFQLENNNFLDLMNLLLPDKRLVQLQSELEKEGKQVCMFNIYVLAKFLIERGKKRYIFLLKPRISDVLATLNDVTKVSFTNKDETVVKSTSPKLIQILMEALEKKKDSDQSEYEVDKIVTWDQVSNKSVMQSYFVHDLTIFLNKYFPVKRKKDALVSTKEVELILYLMKLLGLSTAELTNKRHSQLMSLYKQISKQKQNYGRFNIDGKERILPIMFIPYSVWNYGKLDWTMEELPELKLKTGDKFKF